VHFPGALYHVIVRGNQRQATFRSDADRRRYLDLLKQYRTRYNFHLSELRTGQKPERHSGESKKN